MDHRQMYWCCMLRNLTIHTFPSSAPVSKHHYSSATKFSSVVMSDGNKTQKTLAYDLGTFLESKDAALITVVAGDLQLAVHKAILVANSPVFAAMMARDTQEASSGRIVITDVEPDVVRQLLLYMYKDEIPQLPTIAPQLLVAADKYDIASLKAQCELQLIRDLSVENATTTAFLALRHCCPHLKEAVVCFLQAKFTQVVGTQGWAEAVCDHPKLVVELGHLLAARSTETSTSQEKIGKKMCEAARYYSFDGLQTLLAEGADIEAQDENGNTALHCAAAEGRKDTVRYLLQAGANVRARDATGRTALHRAAAISSKDPLNILLEAGADVGVRDTSGSTALHCAARAACSDNVKKLLQVGAHAAARDRWQQTPLHMAALSSSANVVEQLAAASGGVNSGNMYGDTPLHLAALQGKTGVVQSLLDAGADKSSRNSRGEVPADVAERYRNHHIVSMLR